jgi:nucleotide-binding universal stress UspA family protein
MTTDPIVVGIALRADDTAPLALARDLARFTGAPIALVHVYAVELPSRVPAPELDAAHREHAMQGLEQVATSLRDDVEHVTLAPIGGTSPVRGLHDAAAALEASVVVVGSSHRGRLGRVMPGGVGERLLHAAPCAVAVAPRDYVDAPEGIRRIGVAFVDTPEGHEALDAATTMATLGHAALSTYTVFEPPRMGPSTATPAWVPAADYDPSTWIEAAKAEIREQVPGALDADVNVLEGDPAELLAGVSEHLDLMLCGSRGYGPLGTVLLGSVSARLAHTAECPLLVLPRAHDRAAAGQPAG